jgi:hypothetical protein
MREFAPNARNFFVQFSTTDGILSVNVDLIQFLAKAPDALLNRLQAEVWLEVKKRNEVDRTSPIQPREL